MAAGSEALRMDRDDLTPTRLPMSASAPSVNYSAAASHDPSLDPTIKALLDQQAEIQARLAQLLPEKYGPNTKVELDNLRHKLRVLRTYAADNRKQALLLTSSLGLVWRLRSFSMDYSAKLGVAKGGFGQNTKLQDPVDDQHCREFGVLI